MRKIIALSGLVGVVVALIVLRGFLSDEADTRVIDGGGSASMVASSVANGSDARAAPPMPTTQQTPDASTDTPSVADLVRLTGLVRAYDREGIARVSACITIEGAVVHTSDIATGIRFDVPCAARPAEGTVPGLITVDDGRGHIGSATFMIASDSPSPIDVGEIRLREARATTVRVTLEGSPHFGAKVYVGTRWDLGHGPFVTNDSGEAVVPLPLSERVVLRVHAAPGWRGIADVIQPRDVAGPIEIALGIGWDLRVRVVSERTGQPVPGAVVSVLSSGLIGDNATRNYVATFFCDPAPADEDGLISIPDLDPDSDVIVKLASTTRSAARGGLHGMESGTALVRAEAGTPMVVLTLPMGETFRFPIVEDETPKPPEGSVLDLSLPVGYAGVFPPEHGRVEGDFVVIDDVQERCVNILATAADGSAAVLRILGEARTTKIGSEARFKKPRSLVVKVIERGGGPLVGVEVAILHRDYVAGSPRRLDAGGHARFEGLQAGRYDLKLGPMGNRPLFAQLIAKVDVREQEETAIEVEVEPERRFELDVTVDGVPRLPGDLNVRGQYQRIDWAEEDPNRAKVVFTARPQTDATEIVIVATASGCVSTQTTLSLSPQVDLVRGVLAFESSIAVDVRVLPPLDVRFALVVERLPEGSSKWGRAPAEIFGEEIGKTPTTRRIDRLPPGRYRLGDELTGMRGPAVDLRAGPATDYVLDLSHVRDVPVRIEGPAEKSKEWVVLNWVPGSDGTPRSATLQIGSESKIRVAADIGVSLTVRHESLHLANGEQTLHVEGTESLVIVRLVE